MAIEPIRRSGDGELAANPLTLGSDTLIRTVRLPGWAKRDVSVRVFMAKEADHGDGLSVTKCEEAILTEAALLDFRECSSDTHGSMLYNHFGR